MPEQKKYMRWGSISDIEVLLNVSYRTATRRMQDLKRDLNIPKWKRPTQEQIKQYFSTK